MGRLATLMEAFPPNVGSNWCAAVVETMLTHLDVNNRGESKIYIVSDIQQMQGKLMATILQADQIMREVVFLLHICI